jgi:aminoglycoside 6'-N-acetyltransferase I
MIVVRRATHIDREAIHPFRQALWPEAAGAELLAELTEQLANETYPTWVAWDEEVCVGFGEASLRPFANGCDSRPVAFLEGIWVAPAYRRQGIGRSLVNAVAAWALTHGISELGSDAYIDDTLSHASHRGWGFAEMERVVYFRKKLS